jgi:serine/threonine protein kinase
MEAFDQQGKRLTLSQEVGRGGEATVYRVAGRLNLLAKIYTPSPRPNYPDKLEWMIGHPPENPTRAQSHPSLAWPYGPLYDSPGKNRRLTGYLMPYIQGAVQILEILNPRRRRILLPRFNRRYLHRTARNLAAALSALHRCGYVAGDLNESNILVTPSALVTLIDTDSFQVIQRGDSRPVIYPCPVGKLEYTPAELQGQALDKVYRKPEHDAFSLAVLIFQLLGEGNHPFRAQWLGSGEPPPIEARIKLGAFPYTSVPGSLVKPPKGAPNFNLLHPSVSELLRRCFIDGHEEPKNRPNPAAWESALAIAEEALVSCSAGHLYSNHLPDCPLCSASGARPSSERPRPAAERRATPNRPAPPPRASASPPPRARVGRAPSAQTAGPSPAQPQAFPWSWGGSGQAGNFLPGWLQNQVQQRVQSWIQTQVGVYGVPVATPKPTRPSSMPGSQTGTSQPASQAAGSATGATQPAQQAGPATAARPSTATLHRRRIPHRSKDWRRMLAASLAYGGGTGALAGLLPGALIAFTAFYLETAPALSLMWAFGGAAGAALRGTKIGQRLGLVIAQHLGWRRFWQATGLILGAAAGGILSLPFALAIFPIFIGVLSGARIGYATGNRIWLAGNRLGWERMWALTAGVTAALLGAGAAWLASVSPLGSLAYSLSELLAGALGNLQLAPVWLALASGALAGLFGGAVAGLMIDLSARITNLTD